MGFLSDLTMVQRAGGAAVLVLLLTVLLLKQRKAKGAPATAKSADTPMVTSRKKHGSAPKEKKGRSFGVSRKRQSEAGAVEPVAEPKSGQGRMVPRLPAPSEVAPVAPTLDGPATFPEIADPAEATPLAVAANGMINEPGWPTPGEVWAAPDAPVRESAEVESWQADAESDALAALATDAPPAHTGEWTSDDGGSFDPADGWDASPDDEKAPEAQTDATWQAEGETFDWTAGDAIDGWATSEASVPAEDLTSDAAAWESPEDETPSWSASDTSEWAEAETVEETQAIATAVAEEFSIGDWATPVETTVAEVTEIVEDTPEIIWDPVDEVEAVEDAIEATPAAEDITPVFAIEPIMVNAPHVEETPAEDITPAFAIEPIMVNAPHVEETPAEDITPAFETEPVMEVVSEPVIVSEPLVPEAPVAEEITPVVEPAPIMVSEPEVEVVTPVERPRVVVLPQMPAVDDEFVDDEGCMVQPENDHEVVVAVAAAATATVVVTDPATRWASMAPGGVVQELTTSSPVNSWARLRPGQAPATETTGSNGHHRGGAATQAPAAPVTAPSLAWWDVPSGMESDPRRGRFALGGYALQAGHQVVSGVTFRDGVVPPPTHWVIGPVVGQVASGTLVLHVDGLLNCRSEDLTVLTDPGFAPTNDGFSLRLAASATGPFAVSGTYIIT